MHVLTYVRLIGFTAGTLLQLFWMVVILGYRRRRNFERVFFFLCLALFFFYSGSLLALNAQIYYAQPPPGLQAFAITLICAGLCFLPPLLVHLHWEYAEVRRIFPAGVPKHLILSLFYAPALYFGLRVYPLLASGQGFDFLEPGSALGRGYGWWMTVAFGGSASWEFGFLVKSREKAERMFHAATGFLLAIAAGLACWLHVVRVPISQHAAAIGNIVLSLLAIPLFAAIIYLHLVQRFNFLQIGRQKNLVYAVSATFLALLYLSLVRRVSVWLEPVLPPEASAAILLFLLVIFFEPLQRVLGRALRETAHREMDIAQQMASAIQEVARQGNLGKLRSFVEEWIKERLELAEVGLTLADAEEPSGAADWMKGASNSRFPIQQAGRRTGILHVKPHGAMLSGETRAALEFVCEQLPAALDLCRLIEEKLGLERELAERERLAALGQMAASISHNLKNPLGSIKTILQVQLESPELPEAMKAETRLVLDEIERLSAKLNQLLRFSRPGLRPSQGGESCDAREAAEAVASVLLREAERRGIHLNAELPEKQLRIGASGEAMNEILSNLVVNALEAANHGGHVTLRAAATGAAVEFVIEDDGPGISPAVREQILQPFFTTKAQGTGLGLAIVAKRVAEFGGRLEWESPVKNGWGTRFRVKLPIARDAGKRTEPAS